MTDRLGFPRHQRHRDAFASARHDRHLHTRLALGGLGDVDADARGEEERFGHGIQGRCELALIYYRQLLDVPGVELRTHGTTLYNSIYRADDELLINGHLWGVNAFGAPVWHLRENQAGSMVSAYRASFDAVWERGTPVA